MGMFDIVYYKGRLPVTKESLLREREGNVFKSKSIQLWKSWPEGTGDTLEITVGEDGTLRDPNGDRIDWSGDLLFYGSSSEFVAEIVHGYVTGTGATMLPKGFTRKRFKPFSPEGDTDSD